MDTNELSSFTNPEFNGEFEIAKPEVSPALKESIAKFREDQKLKSFSGRHPELGKMIKCQICRTRHRSSQVCVQVFTKDKDKVERVAQGPGHTRARINNHWSKKRLQLIDLTRQIIKTLPNGEADFKKARSMALNILRKEWHEESNKKQRQQKLSRRINRA